ncbi:Gfo/Idh/MocA family oxidoreductase [Larkinella knui]|uniref:Gfo/Idh/MocA family oxidoreductase n=1 Tax=Larkinella knui TaxID=2025310 RepID=A0A3P1CU84_9BACT|nr:Gfo/Idh/MocA family oxidoreductase [Larkinella knui]RRB16819.1 gfo/Idh/MocA family oxidoreductase [Larkinella knui]
MEKEPFSALSRRKFIGQASAALSAFMIVPRFVLGGRRADGTGYRAPSDIITLGFIGTGKQSRGLSRQFLSTGETRILATAEVYKAKRDLFIEQAKAYYTSEDGKAKVNGAYSEIQAYNDFRQLLDRKDIDAVVIAAPDHWHAVMAVKAAEAGKDIYCEKPLALTIKEGRAMVNATRKHNRVFQTGSMQRSWPEFRQTAELIRNGYIGDIKGIKVSVGPPPKRYDLPAEPIPEGLDWNLWLGPNQPVAFNSELAPPLSKDVFPNWRNYKEFGGGMVTDWGAHMFDIVQWSLDMDNSGPVEVIPPDGKEHKFLTYRYENGITMTHQPWEWSNAIQFVGSEGTLNVQRKKLETTPVALATKVIGPDEKHVYLSENHYKDFLDAMRKRSKPICDVEVGHRTASVCTIGNIAYELKRPLRWDPKKESFKKDKDANALLERSLKDEWAIKV